jgi:toxin ParE1/3/4
LTNSEIRNCDLYIYIATKLLAQTTAESLMDKIENGIMRLKEFPFSGSCVYDDLLKERGYRKNAGLSNNYKSG